MAHVVDFIVVVKIVKKELDILLVVCHYLLMVANKEKGWFDRRIDAGMSQRELSLLSGVAICTISRLENGLHLASPLTAKRLGDVLRKGVSMKK